MFVGMNQKSTRIKVNPLEHIYYPSSMGKKGRKETKGALIDVSKERYKWKKILQKWFQFVKKIND